jgi:hypothetical protein
MPLLKRIKEFTNTMTNTYSSSDLNVEKLQKQESDLEECNRLYDILK